MTRGVLMYAFNNDQIDYVRMARINARQIKHHMGCDVTLVTDTDITHPDINVIRVNYSGPTNTRLYHNTIHETTQLDFRNANRVDAYDISPYDETLLLDADLLVLGDTLNLCWGNVEPLMINHNYQDVHSQRKMNDLRRLHPLGIDMYWATQIYFRKDPTAQVYFRLCQHVKQNYSYYKSLYRWPGNLFRNDFVFSVAAHMFMGFTDHKLPRLPVELYNTFDVDDVHQCVDHSRIILRLQSLNNNQQFVLADWSHNNIHIMNKWALTRVCDQLETLS